MYFEPVILSDFELDNGFSLWTYYHTDMEYIVIPHLNRNIYGGGGVRFISVGGVRFIGLNSII